MGPEASRDEVEPVDLDAPEWFPIHGVSLDRYVELAVRVEGMDPAGRETWLEAEGVGRGTWRAVDEGWRRRVADHPPVADRRDRLAGISRRGRTPPPGPSDR